MDCNSHRPQRIAACAAAGRQHLLRPAEFRKLSVLMPVYNERRTLRQIVARVLESPVPLEIELIAVDDCSTDGSWEMLQELAAGDPRIRPVRHAANQGKGAAIRTAIAQMRGEVAVVQDADLEYDPHEYPLLLEPILQGKADAVFGSRYAGATRLVGGYWHSLVNRLLTWVSNVLNDLNVSDMETCYKMVRADVLRRLRLRSSSFAFEPELTCRLAQFGARIYEVPVSYTGRGYWEGKKIRPIDGLKALWTMFYCRLVDRRFTDHPGYYRQCRQARSRRYRALAHQLKHYLGGRILHVGAGVGNLSRFLADCQELWLVEADPVYTAALSRRFAGCPQVILRQLDLREPEELGHVVPGGFDTIIWELPCGLRYPHRWLRGLWQLLAPGGYCALVISGGEQLPEIEAAMRHAGFGDVNCHRNRRFNRDVVPSDGVSSQSGSSNTRGGWHEILLLASLAAVQSAVRRLLPPPSGTAILVGKKPQQAVQRAVA